MIRENMVGLTDIVQNIYLQTQELSKGMGSSFFSYAGRASGDLSHSVDPTKPVTNFSDAMAMRGMSANWTPPEKSHAFGLNRVPFDDYPALLHEGERVLTAAQARAQDAGQAGAAPIQIIVTGNSFTGTPEEMADQLAEILARKIAQANTAAAPR